jgi:hypothetical protein
MNKISAYNEIEQTLQEIFLNNLNFFKQNHPLIYTKILEFERLNIENYYIDFIDNKFQLFDLHNKINLYEKEPFEDAIDRVDNFDLGSAFNLIKIETLEKKNHYKNEINAYEYLNEFIKNFQNINIKINKFIFIGTLLGIHINDFHKILNAKVYLIIEPNIEIFRLSMFMTDYKILATNSKLFFSINEEEVVQKQIIEKFLKYEYQFNNLIHFELAHKINEPLINKISMIFTHLGEMRYPFSDYLISLNRLHYYFIKNKNNLLNLSKIYNFLENKNVLFLGAGPSLEKDLNFLHLNKHKFIIVAVAATLKTLETKNIIPDIIITVDGQEIVKEQFNVTKFMYENSIILCSNKLDENLYSLLKDISLFFFQNSLNLFRDLGFITGITVGDMGIDLLLKLGVKNLYLLGIDAAIDSETGKTHINSHSSLKNINFNQENPRQINFNETIIYVKGNFEEKVPTLMEYKEMIEEIDKKFEYLNSNFKIHNLSNGAYFKNTIPIKTSDINLEKDIDKNDFRNNFLMNLNTIIEKDLNNIFIKILKKERKILIKLILLKKDMTFFEEFKNIKQKNPSLILINILEKYFNLILPYYHFLENKSIANKILEKQLSELLARFNLLN